MNRIQVKNLHKSFSGQAILRDISFSAGRGDVVALMGTSGSGKSTLLRCMNLLTVPDEGSVIIDGEAMCFNKEEKPVITQKQVALLRRKVGMVFQQYNLWAHMTVLENLIEAPLRVLKQNRKATLAEANELLDKVGLADKAHSYPGQLSGGQQQRAAIARSLMMKPDIMLLDEPTSALDPEMVYEVLTVMQKLAAQGMTMLVATHELNFARRVASHAIFLDDGAIVETGAVDAMFGMPKSERFKRFLSSCG